MEEAFIEHLDQLYWEGYGQEFRESNPDTFQRQLSEFLNIHKAQKHEVPNPLFNGADGGTVRTRKRKRNTGRSGTGDLFNQ